MNKKVTSKVKVGSITIGGDSPISIQSMTNTDTSDLESTKRQVLQLKDSGCDLVRVAFEKVSQAKNLQILSNLTDIVADIQFDYKLAILACECGVAKIRFNPGNIGNSSNIKKVVDACKANDTAVRIGVNSGSIEREYQGDDVPTALVNSLLNAVGTVERAGLDSMVLSIKTSNVHTNLLANRLISKQVDYPLHIGITESGSIDMGLAKSYAGIGALLLDGIGDTIRISLTAQPLQEVLAAKRLLRAVGLDRQFVEVVSCPTCSRCKYDMSTLVSKVEQLTSNCNRQLKVAVMGCVVNGPGEASQADIGIAGGGDGKAVVFQKSNIVFSGDIQCATSKFFELLQQKIAK